MRKHSYVVVDAFTSGVPFSGNPAAVILEAEGLGDADMQSIAAEFNLSETTFILPPSKMECSVRFRWFTPHSEVDMCGHATVAGIHALVEAGRIPYDPASGSGGIAIETRSGVLTGSAEPMPGAATGRMIWLDLPPPTVTRFELRTHELAGLLGVDADAFDPEMESVRTSDKDAIVFVRDSLALNGARPKFSQLAVWLTELGLRGLCLATTKTVTPSVHVQSRFFAPAVGVDEDPVTGSVHGPLAAYLAERGLAPMHDGVSALTCVQSKAGGRGGLLHALVQGSRERGWSVRIAGQATTTMRGELAF